MIESSMVRATGEGAKLAGVPLETREATTENGPIRLDVVLIQKSLGRTESKSSNKTKCACFNSLLDNWQFAKLKGMIHMITGSTG